MKNTSRSYTQVFHDINFAHKALASLTIEQFIEMPESQIRDFTALLEVVQSDDTFEAVFPPEMVLKYHRDVRHLGSYFSAYAAEAFSGEQGYADWCCKKLHQRMDSLRRKFVQMLEGKAFHGTEIPTKRLELYQRLYDVVSDSGKSLVNIRIARAEAMAQRQ